MSETIGSISSAFNPRVVMAAVPKRIPEVTKGDLSSKGTMFLLAVISAFTSASSACFPEMFLLRKSTNIMW